MESWEFTKLAGAVLCALLAIVLPKTLYDLRQENLSHAAHGAEHAGYTLPMPEAAPTKVAAAGAPAAAAAAPAGNIFDAVKPLFAAAKPAEGATTFKACAACHSAEKGGANKVGPALWGIVGRKKAAVEGFGYSAAMKEKAGEWNYETLTAFINNPKGYVSGTKMVYGGLSDPQKLADLMAYLGTLSDAPVALPK